MDIDKIQETVDEVVSALWATDRREHLIVREGWPAASCENVSVAIAAILEDRGLGSWTYVRGSRPGERGGHAWLELRDGRGRTLMSVDATLHQFPEWRTPFVGIGLTPAASVFTDDQWVGYIGELDWIDFDIGRRLLRAVRDQLSS